MRRPLGVLAGLVSLAALGAPIATADAAAARPTECRVTVAKPQVTPAGKIQVSATRRGCEGSALVRVRIKRAVPGPDRIVKSASGRGVSPRVTVALPCTPGVYYASVTDYQGNTGKSRPVRLPSCAPTTPTPTPTGTPSPTGSPTSSPTATPTTTSSPSDTVGTADENEVVRLTNAERAKGGCKPLKHDAQLRTAAFGHSSDMAAKNYFDHTSQDGRSFLDRIRAAGFTGGTGWAENIAMGQPTPASVVTGWMNSPGHKANIMNCKYNLIGVGAAKNSRGQIYWTQDFAAK
ncbi:CAP domain-containing protein [Nonomuraea guangzhouensis]|uniref:CAP domain-containing protein n=1 Tax=Nonomuraea guangzhouensis TaxID=1291555 RepID=A0ABW4G950_9ACTN|nr:CAP domain-containing protein [Nonomuraea guangzhouensis]